MNSTILISLAVLVATAVVIICVSYVLYQTGKPLRPHKSLKPISILIVLGSGGHAAEMMTVLLALQEGRFTPRYHVAAATDNMSLQKARVLEDSVAEIGNKGLAAQFMQIYRSREVGQSYITSVGTALIAIADALWLMIRIRLQVFFAMALAPVFLFV